MVLNLDERRRREYFLGIALVLFNNWNVSNVEDMCSMFTEARSFNQPLNNWNVSKVTNMEAMFWGATSFNQPLNNWNVSKGDVYEPELRPGSQSLGAKTVDRMTRR